MGTEDGNLDKSSIKKEEVIVRGHIGIVGVQMDLGSIRKGVDMGPSAIRHAGLISKLRESGYEVQDIGDIVPLVEGDVLCTPCQGQFMLGFRFSDTV